MLEVLKTQHIGICFGPSNSANRNGVNHNRPSFTGIRYCKGDAAQVLGIALAIKMIAYIGVAPIASAFAERLPRKQVLVGLDVIRALTALCLPFVTQIWQIYILILFCNLLLLHLHQHFRQ